MHINTLMQPKHQNIYPPQNQQFQNMNPYDNSYSQDQQYKEKNNFYSPNYQNQQNMNTDNQHPQTINIPNIDPTFQLDTGVVLPNNHVPNPPSYKSTNIEQRKYDSNGTPLNNY